MIFEALQSELVISDFYSMSSKLQKILEFNLGSREFQVWSTISSVMWRWCMIPRIITFEYGSLVHSKRIFWIIIHFGEKVSGPNLRRNAYAVRWQRRYWTKLETAMYTRVYQLNLSFLALGVYPCIKFAPRQYVLSDETHNFNSNFVTNELFENRE